MLRNLVQREWRDARAVTVVAALLAAGASAAVDHWYTHGKDGALMAVWTVPVLLGLYLAVIASDLVAGEVATRRIDALALLPTGMFRVWAAKVLFALAAGAAFLVWVIGVQLVVLAAGGAPGESWSFVTALPDALPNLGMALALFATVLFFSTLLERGFGAVLAGLMVLGAGVWAWRQADWVGWGLQADATSMGVVATGIAAVFLAGSAIAFVRGPAHGAALRRALAGLAVVLGVLVPTGVGSAVALDRWLTLEPGSREIRIEGIFPSKDGRYVAMRVGKHGRWNTAYLWIVRVADGHLVARPESNLLAEGWTDDGLVTAWSFRGNNPIHNSNGSEKTLLRRVDPETGEIVRTRSSEQVTAEFMGKPAPPPKLSIVTSEGRAFVRDNATGEKTRFEGADGDPKRPWHYVSPHGRYASIHGMGRIVDLAERRVVLQTDAALSAIWLAGQESDRYALTYNGNDPTQLVDLVSGRRTEIVPNPNGYGWPGDMVVVMPEDRFLILRPGQTIDLVDADCRTLRRVWPVDR